MIVKEELLIFFIAIDASVGIFGDSSIIRNAKSLMDETSASNSSSLELGFISLSSCTLALKYGFVSNFQ